MMVETVSAFDDAIRAGELAHVLTVGSPERLALRVTLGRLDRGGGWHPLRPDVFLIWRGLRYGLAELAERAREDLYWRAAERLPRRLALAAAMRVGVHATTGRYADTVVPEISMTDALQRWEL